MSDDMSKDELEKLAAEMKNIKPSDKARARGMEAAMAAFGAEFASSEVGVADASEIKISEKFQGSADEARPTGQTNTTSRSFNMPKLSNIFSMPPKAAMMLASCAAALTISMVIITPEYLQNPTSKKFETVASGIEGDEALRAPEVGSDEIVVTGRRVERPEKPTIATAPPPPEMEVRLSDADSNMGLSKQASRENRAILRQSEPSAVAGIEPQVVEPPSRDQFEKFESNPVASVKEQPVSTFSIDVDTASYSFLRSSINRGQLPPPGSRSSVS